MSQLHKLAILAFLLFGSILSSKWDDEIKNLPGLTFEVNFKQFSGYLSTSSNSSMHYWFVESQSNPLNDSLILWLNGGPGCSSLGGSFEENGFAYPNPDGNTLFENVFSWNKIGNILYLESPRDVGFSYGTGDYTWSDDQTAQDNADSIVQFLERFPEYNGRDFYITGESYGGVYLPTLGLKIINLIQSKKLNLNFKGIAIGNGILSQKLQVNSYINLNYIRGALEFSEYTALSQCCDSSVPLYKCNFYDYLIIDSYGNLLPKNYTDNNKQNCANIIYNYSVAYLWAYDPANSYPPSRIPGVFLNDAYNNYLVCYNEQIVSNSSKKNDVNHLSLWRRYLLQNTQRKYDANPIMYSESKPFVDQLSLYNTMSTDNLGGFPCYASDAKAVYLNRKDVQSAIHVDVTKTAAGVWTDCSASFSHYKVQYPDMTPIFKQIIDTKYPVNIMLYNGDVDSVCNFLGDQWFMEELATNNGMTVKSEYSAWNYTQSPGVIPKIGGYFKQFTFNGQHFDIVTVKGAGHFVPRDRPGPMLQVLSNFIKNNNYNTPLNVSITPKPLFLQYQGPIIQEKTRKQKDQIINLPGLTVNINFNQYSGYLKGIKGNYLHYWFVESKIDPERSPLVLWLNGGPGCSSVSGLLTELGPLHVNPDGKTLFDNVYSWNTKANVLFLEAPRNVGFSWQNKTENNGTLYDDDLTVEDNYLALKDFYSVYPEYAGRPFYVAAESYGGIYGPTLTARLIKGIQANDFPACNLQGMAIGNGELSNIKSISSTIANLYFHGIIGVEEWSALRKCCPGQTYQELAFCDFSQFITYDKTGNPVAKVKGDECGNLVAKYAFWNWENSDKLDVYNIYQDCYQQKAVIFGSRKKIKNADKLKKQYISQSANGQNVYQKNPNPNVNDYSSDPLGGFACWASSAATTYLNTPDVRDSLHIPSYVPRWDECNSSINTNYNGQYNDTSSVFQEMINSNYPLRILIYNGDVDTACDFLADQWFIEELAAKNNYTVSVKRDAWWFRQQIAGYWKQFQGGKITIDQLTVKGAGHLVPLDRPGPALQMINNFLQTRNYSHSIEFNLAEGNLLPQYSIQQQISIAASHPKTKQYRPIRHMDALLNKKNKKPVPQKVLRQYNVPIFNNKSANLVTSWPGITFKPTFKTYSGYLSAKSENDVSVNAPDQIFLHYMLTEHQTDPMNTPLILWFNGGPGCSSMGGALTELSPFRASPDGSLLYENPYAWNRLGNILFLESPRGVGFSYSTDGKMNVPYNDTTTANHNVAALLSFYQTFPEYKNRPFFITGESYGGVYVPTFTDALIKRIQSDNINYINFQGVAIGNGELSEVMQVNSAVDLLYFRGIYGLDEFKAISSCCPSDPFGNSTDICDFTKYIYLDVYGNANPKPSDDPVFQKCANLVVELGFNLVWTTANDVYNTYQDCYASDTNSKYLKSNNNGGKALFGINNFKNVKSRYSIGSQPLTNNYTFIDQRSVQNLQSTDAINGFYCHDGSTAYLNRLDVKQALHVDETIIWEDCNDYMNAHYIQMHNDTTSVFNSIIASQYPLRFLIYNGDVDMACEFLGDQWFVRNLVKINNGNITSPRAPWTFNYPNFYPRIAGFTTSFQIKTITIDQATVKGAGHFVPEDRSQQMLQLLTNFVKNTGNFSIANPMAVTQPLLSNAAPQQASSISRKDADMIYNLPGLTYTLNFNQYSGYLNSAKGDYLHYWFIESQRQPSQDPVVLWLTGGPGCSSLGSLLTEIGAFHVNPDGRTLYENIYSWNKFANILFLESPREVGFSYHNTTENPSNNIDDYQTAVENANALADFFNNVFPEYKNNDFYITGESYAGIYIPTLSLELLNRKLGTNGFMKTMDWLNFKGFSIGNGELSEYMDVRTNPEVLYFHGLIGKTDYDAIQSCCPKDQLAQGACHYDELVKWDTNGYLLPLNASDPTSVKCANLVNDIAGYRKWMVVNDVYNMYQNCYEQTTPSFGSSISERHRNNFRNKFMASLQNKKNNIQTSFSNQLSKMNYASTDPQGGFQCYMSNGMDNYLNQAHVRDAIHIPDYVQQFQFCSDTLNYTSLYKYFSLKDTFKSMMELNYPLRTLIYTGDVDLACGMMESQFFVEDLYNDVKNKYQSTNSIRKGWTYQYGSSYYPTLAGYQKSFKMTPNFSLDLLSVKGGSHFVPTSRPAQALQMIYNFISNTGDYSLPSGIDITRQPLLPQYQPQPIIHVNVTSTQNTITTTTTKSSSRIISNIAILIMSFWFLYLSH
ncbi:Lysosomal protective protein [Strongyloides ratti]|uniref:Carboxypeptidase n=1 Tax=Strongyloides ratti TaxID=34506 RepID=A0A090KXV0_STRRB|nr:Lysosomal protective protein [Strongyloides ratti]CEF62221.1 Lysosomal protective protein [Strongyloides ratti]